MALEANLAIQGVLAFVTGFLYVYVARTIGARALSAEARNANRTFAVWWLALGALYLAASALDFLSAVGFRDVAIFVTFVNVILLLLCLAIWGLNYYLAYLYTGSQRALWVLSAFYAGLAVATLYLITWMEPTGFDETQFTLMLTYTRQPPPVVGTALGLAFAVPVVLAALAYGSLYFRVQDRSHRFRIGVVAGSFLVWFGWSTAATLFQLNVRYQGSLWLLVVNQLIALAVPLAVIVAYRPPSWIRRRLDRPSFTF
jgi:hypothetical protein